MPGLGSRTGQCDEKHPVVFAAYYPNASFCITGGIDFLPPDVGLLRWATVFAPLKHAIISSFSHSFLTRTKSLLPAWRFHTLWNESSTIARYRITGIS
jgi:hypothetical protein